MATIVRLRIAMMALALVLALSSVAPAAPVYTVVNQAGVSPDAVRAAGEVVEKCAQFYATILKVVLSRQIQMHFYPNAEAFARGLQEIARDTPQEAARWARTATLRAIGVSILVHQARLSTLPPNDVTLSFCSAVGLMFQTELVTERSVAAHQWMRQGHGLLLAAQALDAFGMETMATTRTRAVRVLKDQRERNQPFPPFASMTTRDQYLIALEQHGPTIRPILILATDLLLGKSSPEAFLAYFRGLAIRSNVAPPRADEVFRTSFGLTVEQFQAQFDAHLAATLR